MILEYIIEMKAKVLIDRRLVLGVTSRFVANLQVLSVPKSEKFPRGIKVRFVLLDTVEGTARLLVDNHEPYGFHIHTKLPKKHDHREKLETTDHEEALQRFLAEAERIVRDEEK